jgi:hypothetical protein
VLPAGTGLPVRSGLAAKGETGTMKDEASCPFSRAGRSVIVNKIRAALMAGVLSFAAGLVVGVIFAPASGARTRRRLRRRGEELADKAAESVQDIVDRARRRIA